MRLSLLSHSNCFCINKLGTCTTILFPCVVVLLKKLKTLSCIFPHTSVEINYVSCSKLCILTNVANIPHLSNDYLLICQTPKYKRKRSVSVQIHKMNVSVIKVPGRFGFIVLFLLYKKMTLKPLGKIINNLKIATYIIKLKLCHKDSCCVIRLFCSSLLNRYTFQYSIRNSYLIKSIICFL